MTASTEPKFLSQADFAKRRGVSRKSVTLWKQKDLLVFSEAGLIDVERSEWNLDQRLPTYRGGVTHRPVRVAPGNKSDKPAGKSARAERRAPATEVKPRPGDGQPDPDAIDLSAENLPLPEAVRRKENYLGLLRKRDLEISNGEWVRVEDVGTLVEQDYAKVRERLLVIPGKHAAELVGKDRAAIEGILLRAVTEALHELHDQGGIARDIAAREAAGPGEEGP